MNNILTACGVTKIYHEGSNQLYALRELDLSIREGETIAITGQSGAGKSTLLHILGLLDTSDSGTVTYRNSELSSLSGAEMADIRNRRFGFIFQAFHLLPDLNAVENVMLPDMISAGYLSWRRRKQRQKAMEVLAMVGLDARARHKPAQLSGGERQRVAIARALIKDPDVIFCDEPTGNLDSKTSAEIHDLIFNLNKKTGQTFVIVTHDMTLASRADRVARMRDGTISEIITNNAPPDSQTADGTTPAN